MFKIGNLELQSRLLLGTGKSENEEVQLRAIETSETNVLTFAVRRVNLYNRSLLNPLANINLKDLITFPNTAGAKTAQEAIRITEIVNHAGVCDMTKVGVIGDDETLLPDPFETYEVRKVLLKKGCTVCPYISNNLVLAQRLEELGAHAVMPFTSPIGTGRGISNPLNLSYIIENVSVPVIVDAGIDSPKDARRAIGLGADSILLNTATSAAKDPVKMAEAIKLGINIGRLPYGAGRIPVEYTAQASSPSEGLGFL